MANVRFLRQLPQTYGLTGRKTRTPINVKYSSKPSLSSIYKMPERVMANLERLAPVQKKQVAVQEEISPDFGGGPGVGPGEGLGGMSGEIGGTDTGVGISGILDQAGQTIGNQAAASIIGRGVKGAATTGIMGLLANVSANQIAPFAMQSALMSAMAPVGIAKTIANMVAKGYNANQIAQAMEESGIVGEGTDLSSPMGQVSSNVMAASMENSPQTAFGTMMGMAKGVPGAGPIGQATSEAALQGLSQSPGLTQGSDDPVAATLLQPKTHIPLKNMMAQNLSAQSPYLDPTVNPVTPMMLEPSMIAPPSDTEPMTSMMDPTVNPVTPAMLEPSMIAPPPSITPMGAGPGGGGGTSPGGSMGPPGTPGAAGMDAGPDGGGDGGPTVICTELHNQGLMSGKIYEADCAYGASLDYEVMDGYLVWGKPLASLMARSRLVTAIIKYPALKWAKHMAGNPNLFGAIAVRIGIPMCRNISRMKRLVKCQLRSTSQ